MRETQQTLLITRTRRRTVANRPPRGGKILVLMAVLLPVLIGIVGLVIDGGLMMGEYRQLQHASDAAATAAAMDVRLGKSNSQAIATATELLQVANEFADAGVVVNIPPAAGDYAGQAGHVEVLAGRDYQSRFMRVLDGVMNRSINTRAVAGLRDATAGGAIVVLDPDPDPVSIDLDEIVLLVDGVVLSLLDESVSVTAVNQTLPTLNFSPITSSPLLTPLLTPVRDALTQELLGLDDNVALIGIAENLVASTLSGLPLAPLPQLTAGMEVEGLGQLRVDGAIFVNNQWGGVDENGETVGSAAAIPYALACMPLLQSTQVLARDIRVVGGVDNPDNYQPVLPDDPNPLQANRLPVLDPLRDLPAPTTSSDSTNVNTTLQNGNRINILSPGAVLDTITGDTVSNILAQVLPGVSALLRNTLSGLLEPILDSLVEDALLALLGPEAPPLAPGVYDSIHVVSIAGGVTFQPGVYIVRGGGSIPLLLIGDVRAEGVMFYITNAPTYDGVSGAPDGDDGEEPPAGPSVPTLAPSAVILPLLGSRITGLDDPGSPFDGMLIYQRRQDRRPLIISAHHLTGSGDFAGTIYAKWAHMIFVGGLGSYDLRFAVGTLRLLTLFDTTIAPAELFPPAQDVLLLE